MSKSPAYGHLLARYYDLEKVTIWPGPLTLKIKATFCSPLLIMWGTCQNQLSTTSRYHDLSVFAL